MRKLILTSFTMDTGGQRFSGDRIVIIDSAKGNTIDDDREQAAEVFEIWAKTAFPESEIISIVPHETVELNESYGAKEPSKKVILTQAFGPNEFPKVDKVWSAESEETISVHVLIDIDGNKQYFDTGWYNFTEKKWHNCNREFDTQISKNEFKWMYIP